jgi:hypothetical protein
MNRFIEELDRNNITYESITLCGINFEYYFKNKRIVIFICDPLKYNEKNIDKNYLKNLHDKFADIGIKLYIIYDCEIENKYDKIVHRMIHKLLDINKNIYARKCQIKELDSKTCCDFVDKYHYQGKIMSKYRYGLFYQNELLAVMTFNKSRYNGGYDYEISRYCVKYGYNIPGNASKLFNYFINNVGTKVSIISYNDLRMGSGTVYEKIGLTRLADSACGFFWYKNNDIFNRRAFWKNTLYKKLEHFDPSVSAHNNMRNNEYIKIFDIGQSVYIFNNK